MKKGLLIGALFSLALVIIGCGVTTQNSTYYYHPSWTSGGNIIFIKGLQSVDKNFVGSQTGSNYTESLMTMSTAGAGETFLFDMTGAPPIAMTTSPTGEYVAYGDDLRKGLFGKIVILNIGAGSHSGLNKVELAFPSGVAAFDWSSDGTKLAYCTTSEVHTIKVDGSADTLVTAEADISFVSWKYGNQIAFVHTAGGSKLLSLIVPGGARTDMAAGASVDKPQISAISNNIIYGIGGSSYCSVDISLGTPATTEVLPAFRGDLPRLSPDATKAVYSKVGEQSGIYLLDVNTKVETQIK